MTMPMLGRLLIGVGLAVAALGAVFLLFGALPRLPGDIYVQRKGFTLYIPILGSVLVSLLLTILLNLFLARR